ESLHSSRERHTVVGLHDEVELIVLHRAMHHLEALFVAGLQGALDHPKAALRSQLPNESLRPPRDVHRELFRHHRTSRMRNDGTIRPGLTSGALPLAAPTAQAS